MRTACETYVDHLRGLGRGKTADDAKRRFAQYVNNTPLGKIELQRLKPRDVYLDAKQRCALIAKAPADFANFLSALSLIPLRPGAMAALMAGDFDKRLSTLSIGKDKAGADRKITLPTATAAYFAEQCKDKLPAAPLFARADGSAWNKDAWKHPFKDAVVAAELPAATTTYALRHSTITDLIALHRIDTLSREAMRRMWRRLFCKRCVAPACWPRRADAGRGPHAYGVASESIYSISGIFPLMHSNEKLLIWLGSSKKDLMALPTEVRKFFGHALDFTQRGDRHDAAKVLKGFGGAGVLEIVEDDAGGTYRAVYTVKFEEAMFVLHCFQKKSKHGIATPKQDIEIIRARLKVAELLAKELRDGKTHR